MLTEYWCLDAMAGQARNFGTSYAGWDKACSIKSWIYGLLGDVVIALQISLARLVAARTDLLAMNYQATK